MLVACGPIHGDDAGIDTDADLTGVVAIPWTTGAESSGSTSGEDDVASTSASDPGPELVTVGHDRELRGVWIASVYNMNFPRYPGMSAADQRAQLASYVDVALAYNFNALFFQVRPEMDALYDSDLEPWSRYLTGTQGEGPGFDPLAFLLDESHAAGLEVHAWFNPYRAATSTSATMDATHISQIHPEYTYAYGSNLWMDPGADEIQDHDVDVILDVVHRYDIDGIHFDDYFYPYPDGTAFPDDATYAAYVADGGFLDLADWRRDNVNRLVARLHDEVRDAKPWVRFGISPFGIYRPGSPPGITGLDQYAEIFADPVKWVQEGWVDYIAPQLYWPTTQTAQAFEPLLEWWVSVTPAGHNVFAGLFLNQLGNGGRAWTVEEFRLQVELSRAYQLDSPGNIFFHIDPLLEDRSGVATMLRDEFYRVPVLPPPLWERAEHDVAPPAVDIHGSRVTLDPGGETPIKAWVIYRDDGDGFALDRIAWRSDGNALELASGRWAVTAASRSDVESLGVVVQIP